MAATATLTASPGAPTATATSAAPVSTEAPDAARIMEHVEVLAVQIGARAAGTRAEDQAADYIAKVLRDAGYEVEIQDFTFDTEIDASEVNIPDGVRMTAIAMEGAPNAEVTGPVVYGGLGRDEDLDGVDLDDRIVIFDRGTVMFLDMARAAEERGAIAVIVVNDEEGPFRGTFGSESASIPVVSVELRHRQALLDAAGPITVVADSGMRITESQNVVATSGEQCQGYLGAHYDSVAQGPGANDNASGTAVIMEVARVNRRDGLCIIAFGSEEIDLYGSRAYVDDHLSGMPAFMLNVDMAGHLDGPIIVGNEDLTNAILDAVSAAGLDSPLRRGAFPPFASSDHVSFEAVGIPSVTFNSGNDEFIHTAEDTIDRVDLASLAIFADAVDAALDVLLPHPASSGTR